MRVCSYVIDGGSLFDQSFYSRTGEGKHQPIDTHAELVRLTTAMRETDNYRIRSYPWFRPNPQNIAIRGGILHE